MDLETVLDEEITKFEEVLHSAEDKSRFDEKAQLLDTKYFTQLTRIVAKLLPKLKQTFKKVRDKLVIVNLKVTELEGRIETLEQSLLTTPPSSPQ